MTFDICLHEVCVRTGVRYVITKFSGMDSLPNFVTHGAPLRALRALENSAKRLPLPFLVHFEAMSRVVNNNRCFLQLLADCPAYQRQFLLKTATPQQLHALVQVLYNVLMGHIPISEENKRILLPYKDALLDLASPNVPYKTKKRVLVQEGSGFIEDVLAPVVSSLGFLML